MTGNGGIGVVTLGDADRALALAAIRQFLRIETTGDDAAIVALAETAMGLAEMFVGKVLIARQIDTVISTVPGWQRLNPAPVTAITAVAGLASDGTVVALPPVDYVIDIDAHGEGWVRVSDAGGASRVQVTVSAGIAAGWTDVPAPIRQGIVLLAAYLFAERETTRPPPAAITALWRPFRGMALTQGIRA